MLCLHTRRMRETEEWWGRTASEERMALALETGQFIFCILTDSDSLPAFKKKQDQTLNLIQSFRTSVYPNNITTHCVTYLCWQKQRCDQWSEQIRAAVGCTLSDGITSNWVSCVICILFPPCSKPRKEQGGQPLCEGAVLIHVFSKHHLLLLFRWE